MEVPNRESDTLDLRGTKGDDGEVGGLLSAKSPHCPIQGVLIVQYFPTTFSHRDIEDSRQFLKEI